eukprot:8750690-Alexandrium_andersonii.AAC.1
MRQPGSGSTTPGCPAVWCSTSARGGFRPRCRRWRMRRCARPVRLRGGAGSARASSLRPEMRGRGRGRGPPRRPPWAAAAA